MQVCRIGCPHTQINKSVHAAHARTLAYTYASLYIYETEQCAYSRKPYSLDQSWRDQLASKHIAWTYTKTHSDRRCQRRKDMVQNTARLDEGEEEESEVKQEAQARMGGGAMEQEETRRQEADEKKMEKTGRGDWLFFYDNFFSLNFFLAGVRPKPPDPSVMYVPLQINGFAKSVLLIVQYRYLKSFSRDFYSP